MTERKLLPRDKKQLALRLVLADVLSRPGEEGPLAPRFRRERALAMALAARRARGELPRE